MSELNEKYMIKCVEPYPFKKGYVAVTLSPLEKIEEDEPNQISMGVFPEGNKPPKEVLKQVNMIMTNMTNNPNQIHPQDCRDIVLLISEIDFYSTEWHYGDIIGGHFKKTKDAREIKPEIRG